MTMARVFLSLGANLGDRMDSLTRAAQQLGASAGIRLVEVSRIYETEPWEVLPGQVADRARWFLNCVVEIETTLSPQALLRRVQEIERSLGRQPTGLSPEARRYEPRTLDIDILLYGREVISGPDDLHIPHLLMHERGFVLRPLADLAPELEHPVLYQTVGELLEQLEDEHRVFPSDLPPRWFSA
jgi:2-amino-4-hydroxy-6-hydroxymethyldihydropteridine diphosphokinase